MSNYLVLSVVSFIESNDLRFGERHNATERFCSFTACVGLVYAFAFPFMMFALHLYKLRYLDPNLQKLAKIEEMMKEHKGPRPGYFGWKLFEGENLKVALLQSQKHKEFMKTYGLLIKGLKLRRQDSIIIALTPIVELLFKLLISFGVTRLVGSPVAVIILFNFATLINLQFILYFEPYEDKWE